MNFQNIPRDDKVVKRAIVPKLGALSYFDYSQIEPRLTAYFASKIGHDEFAELIRGGVDSYTAVARLITGKDEVTPDERQQWKRVYLSLLYGGGVNTIQEQRPDLSRAGARKIIDTFHDNWPAVRALQDDVIRVAARRGYIKSLGGRRLHMEEFGEHKLLNKLIQGSAADVMKEALIRIHFGLREAGVDSHMVSVVHDEAQLDGPVREVPVLHELVPPLMQNVFPQVNEVVPILVEHEVTTTSWADKVDYEEWRKSV